MIRTAFVLGAGLGTRLKSLTARLPKPLIPVANRPLLTYAFEHLLGAGVEKLIVNTHWRSAAYGRVFPTGAFRGASLSFRDEQPEVLETAGGIWNVRDLIGENPFFVYNGDILCNSPLEPITRHHLSTGNEVTLVLRSSGGPLQVGFDATSGRVTDIGGRVEASAAPRFLFTGIYVVNPEFIARIPPATKVSVIPIFCEMIRSGAKLGAMVVDEGEWWDLGNRESYLAVHAALAARSPAPWLDASARIDPTAQILGATAIGPGVRVGAGATLRDCIVWEGAEIASVTSLDRCIVTADQRVQGVHAGADF